MSSIDVSRRLVCAGLVLGAAAPGSVLAQQVTRSRSFDILRAGSNIGEHRVRVDAVDGGLRATTNIAIAVKVLGITAYRYGLDYEELYDGEGQLVSLTGTANDNGKQSYVNVSRAGEMVEVDSTEFSGQAPGGIMPTSYWPRATLERTPWISTQTGKLLNVSVSPTGSDEGPEGASAYRASDGGKFDVNLFYDARGEWVGTAFDAGGERATYRLREDTGVLNL